VISILPKEKEMEKFNFEGQEIEIDREAEIKPGDTYIAKRNTGWKLLTCKDVSPHGFINPIEREYNYDTHECIKVVKI
jgi:hypothetical protein